MFENTFLTFFVFSIFFTGFCASYGIYRKSTILGQSRQEASLARAGGGPVAEGSAAPL